MSLEKPSIERKEPLKEEPKTWSEALEMARVVGIKRLENLGAILFGLDQLFIGAAELAGRAVRRKKEEVETRIKNSINEKKERLKTVQENLWKRSEEAWRGLTERINSTKDNAKERMNALADKAVDLGIGGVEKMESWLRRNLLTLTLAKIEARAKKIGETIQAKEAERKELLRRLKALDEEISTLREEQKKTQEMAEEARKRRSKALGFRSMVEGLRI